MAIGTPNRKRLTNRLLRIVGRSPELQDPHHFREYTPTELTQLAAGVGLRHVKTVTYGMSLVMPRVDKEIVPNFAYLHLGKALPPIANLFFTIYRT